MVDLVPNINGLSPCHGAAGPVADSHMTDVVKVALLFYVCGSH